MPSRSVLVCASLLWVLALMTACDGGSGDSPGDGGISDTGDAGGSEERRSGDADPGITMLEARATITAPEGSRILDAALSPDGSEVAVLFDNLTQPTGLLMTSFADRNSLQVFDTDTGSRLRTLDDPGDVTSGLGDLYWGKDRITLLLFPGLVTWDALGGEVIRRNLPVDLAPCDFLGPNESFDATGNQLFVSGAPGGPDLCVLDFNTGEATPVELMAPADATRVVALQRNPAGTELLVSFEDDNLRDVGTRPYALPSLDPAGAAQPLGKVLVNGESHALYSDELTMRLQPLDVELAGFDSNATGSADGRVVAILSGDTVRFVSLPDARYLGEAERDSARARSFAVDGSIVASVIESERLAVYALGEPAGDSALAPPLRFPGAFAGAATMDDATIELSGTCLLETDEDLGPVNIVAEAASDDGNVELFLRGLGLGISWGSVRYTVDDRDYYNSNVVAQNYMVDAPEVTIDGQEIAVSSLLYTSATTGEIALEPDPSDATGYATRMFLLEGTCMP